MEVVYKDNIKHNEVKSSHNKISKNAIENLVIGKPVIKSKDGVAIIDSSHPDYEFWLEE